MNEKNVDENDESNCQTCTTTNTTCPDDTDCIIVGANTNGTCVDSGVCTADKKTLCDEAYAVVTGKTDNRAKCCPATSGCVRTQIGVKATSTCSVNCGDCLSEFNSQGTNVPATFCMFGQRLSELQWESWHFISSSSSFCDGHMLTRKFECIDS